MKIGDLKRDLPNTILQPNNTALEALRYMRGANLDYCIMNIESDIAKPNVLGILNYSPFNQFIIANGVSPNDLTLEIIKPPPAVTVDSELDLVNATKQLIASGSDAVLLSSNGVVDGWVTAMDIFDNLINTI